jgi:alcohol dehydrogenase class IV
MGIAGILIIMVALAALAVIGIFAITHYAGYTKARLLHAQEMIKLRETSDENAHRRYIEMRKLEDHLAQPGSIREIELEAAHAEARAREAAATESLEKYRELHRHRY